ncbi:MAG TPA: class F sortase [Thermomicrobiales bacterium]|nr:class F sortase [Thermomicrobiales bacterium]
MRRYVLMSALVAIALLMIATSCSRENVPVDPDAQSPVAEQPLTPTPVVPGMPVLRLAPTTGAAEPEPESTSTPIGAVETPRSTEATVEPDEAPRAEPDDEPEGVELVEPPVRLWIPALGVDTVVQWVGRDDEGRMATPSNYTDAAWYEGGPPPGTVGNAVIAGHLDSTSGPAVFYRLGDLAPGDEVYVTTSAGVDLRFVVQGVEAYDASDAPLERIFGAADAAQLNLITCSGRFNRSTGEYDERLVVYTTLAID